VTFLSYLFPGAPLEVAQVWKTTSWILHNQRLISKFHSGLGSGVCFLCVVLALFVMLPHNFIWCFCSPWSAASPASSPVAAPVMFSAIVEEELQQEAALIRSREKPLALIQVMC